MADVTRAALFLSIPLIGWAALLRSLTGTWLNPGSFFALLWCFAGILPLVAAPHEPVGTNAMIWLIAANIAITAGAVIGNKGWKTRLAVSRRPATDRELLILGLALVVSLVLGIGSNISFAAATGVALTDMFDLEKLVVISYQGYAQLYDLLAPPPPLLSRAFLPFVYLAPLLGGFVFELRHGKLWKLIALAAFFPALAVTVLQTTKAATLWAMSFWLSGYFAARLRAGKTAVFTKRHLLVAGAGGTVLTTFFFAVQLARMRSTDVSLLNIVTVKLVTAALGHMSVFSKFLSDYWQHPIDPSLGTLTFSGPLELMGYSRRMPGLFEDVIQLVAGETSNIYTAFRPLIQDFTIPGALAILASLGFVGGIGFRLVAAGRWSAVPLLVIAYVTIFWTPVTWFWVYNSLTATVVAVGLIVFLIRLIRGRSNLHFTEGRIAGTT